MKTLKITSNSEIEDIIRSCEFCTISINDVNGYPYLAPMNFAYHDQKIILHSAPEGTHLQLLEATDGKITICFCTNGKLVYQHKKVACSYRMNASSVVCKGTVSFIDDTAEKENYLNILMAHYTHDSFKYSEPALKNVKVWIVNVEEITARAFGQPHKR